MQVLYCAPLYYVGRDDRPAACHVSAATDPTGHRPHVVLVREHTGNPGLRPWDSLSHLAEVVLARLAFDPSCTYWVEMRPDVGPVAYTLERTGSGRVLARGHGPTSRDYLLWLTRHVLPAAETISQNSPDRD